MSKIDLNNINNNQASKYKKSFKFHSITCSLAHLFTCLNTHLITFILITLSLPAFAYEDCIISTNGKMSDIKIQDNKIIDVFPLITVMNDKNTLIVHPLKEGKTKFSIVKNGKDKYVFDVDVKTEKTSIDNISGFDILTVDCPPNMYSEIFDLDEPPTGMDIDEPPVYKERNRSE